MISLLRVDHRLLHGQVAFSWVQNLKIDCILIANDNVANDSLRKTTMKLAKPRDIKLVIKTIKDSIYAIKSGITDKYKLFIIVETISDAFKISKEIDEINQINLGGTKYKEDGKNISKVITVSKEDEKMLKILLNMGKEIEIRQLPNDSKINYNEVM